MALGRALLRYSYSASCGVCLQQPCQTTAPPLLPAAPPPGSGVSHLRKLRSYRVESHFYERVAPLLPADAACHVAQCLGVHSTLDSEDGSCGGGMQLVMRNLRQRFPRR